MSVPLYANMCLVVCATPRKVFMFFSFNEFNLQYVCRYVCMRIFMFFLSLCDSVIMSAGFPHLLESPQK